MNFRDALLWAALITCISLYVRYIIWFIFDMYFKRKEKHIQKTLNVLSEAIKKISEKKEKE